MMRDTSFPTAVLLETEAADPPEPQVVLSVLPVDALVERLEGISRASAASVNQIPLSYGPVVSIEVAFGPRMPGQYSEFSGFSPPDLVFVQDGRAWRPDTDAFGDRARSVLVLDQTLGSPCWIPFSSGFGDDGLVAPFTSQHYVVFLPLGTEHAPLRLVLRKYSTVIEVPTAVVSWPPHPLVWWGSEPKESDTIGPAERAAQ